MSDWVCADCENENAAANETCEACDTPRPAVATDDSASGTRAGFLVGLVATCEPVAGKDKLLALTVDVGGTALVAIVTNAGNVKVGSRVVVAMVGATVGDIIVKKAVVGGRPSAGMLCDAPMLGWVGGGAGAAAILPDSFPVGGPPPEKRPRMDGK